MVSICKIPHRATEDGRPRGMRCPLPSSLFPLFPFLPLPSPIVNKMEQKKKWRYYRVTPSTA